MKRLFCVKSSKGTIMPIVTATLDGSERREVRWFEKKQDAKAWRNMLNSEGGKPVAKGYYVSRGPDHIGPHGHSKIGDMRRQPE